MLKKLCLLGFTLVGSGALFPSMAFAQTYTGVARVVPGWTCRGDSYYISMQVVRNRFTAIVTRQGGRNAGSSFDVEGRIDQQGRFDDRGVDGDFINQAAISPSFFFKGRIVNDIAVGSSGAYTSSSSCAWVFDLERN